MAENRVQHRKPVIRALNALSGETLVGPQGLLVAGFVLPAFRTNFMFRKPTKESILLKHALEERGLRVLAEVSDGYKHVDLAIPDARINIEVDGRQHLTNARQILSDLARTHYSVALGYDTIHIHNEEILRDLDTIADAIAQAAIVRTSQ